MYATDRKEGYVLRKLQRGLSAIEKCCECWNIKAMKIRQSIYFSHRLRPPDGHLTFSVKFLNVIFDKRTTRGLPIEIIEVKAIGSFIRIYCLFKSELLKANSKLTLHKALIRSVMTYAYPGLGLAAAPTK
jgi:hypothetical protein